MIIKNGKRIDGLGDSMPIGSIIEYGGTNIPDGWEEVLEDSEKLVVKRGTNLLHPHSWAPQNGNRAITTYIENGFNFAYIEPLIGSGEGYYTTEITLEKGKTYVLRFQASDGVAIGNVRSAKVLADIDDNYQEWERRTNGYDYVIEPAEEEWTCLRIWVSNSQSTSNGADSGNIFNFMLVELTEDFEGGYEPYEEPQILVQKDEDTYSVFNPYQKHMLCAYLSTEQTLTTNSDQRSKIPLDKYAMVGHKLTFNPNNKTVVIGEGVRKVRIKGSIMYSQPATQNNRALDIAINGVSKSQKLETLYNTARTFGTIEMELPIVEVSSGDIVSLLIRTVAQTGQSVTVYDGMGSTYLCVEVLE